jgi:hypothetical protein
MKESNMKLGGHRPGSLTAFVDGNTGEMLLQIAADPNGEPRVAFRLFDSNGNLVQDSDGFKVFPQGLDIRGANDEQLLELPDDPTGNVKYRLYNCDGRLLTTSDGSRTQILGGLRIEGAKVPSRTKAASKA